MVELPRRGVGEAPQLFAGGEVQRPQGVASGVVSVQQVDLTAADNGAAVADADRSRPKDLGTLLRPGAQLALLRGGPVPLGSEVPRLILGKAGDARQSQE